MSVDIFNLFWMTGFSLGKHKSIYSKREKRQNTINDLLVLKD